MKIEEGKRYVQRNGETVGPIIPNPHDNRGIYPWVSANAPEASMAWREDGAFYSDLEDRRDLVAEVCDPVEPHLPPPEREDVVCGTGFVGRDAYGIAAMDALDEVRRARTMFGPMASMHEGYAVILEELDEVKEIVWMKQKNRDLDKARKEVLQVAAMCISFAAELCTEERGRR